MSTIEKTIDGVANPVRYDPETDVHRYDLGPEENVAVVVIHLLSEVADDDFGRLGDVIDPDSLNALFRGRGQLRATVAFPIDRYEVTVYGDRRIEIRNRSVDAASA